MVFSMRLCITMTMNSRPSSFATDLHVKDLLIDEAVRAFEQLVR